MGFFQAVLLMPGFEQKNMTVFLQFSELSLFSPSVATSLGCDMERRCMPVLKTHTEPRSHFSFFSDFAGDNIPVVFVIIHPVCVCVYFDLFYT